LKKLLLTLFFAAVFLSLLVSAGPALEQEDEVIKLYMGTNRAISVSNPRRIAIADPKVADVSMVTKTEITLVPKAEGRTTFDYWDNYGKQSLLIKVFSDNADDIKSQIDALLEKIGIKGVYTKIDEEQGRVFIGGNVRTTEEKEKIYSVLGDLKGKATDLVVVKEEEAAVEIDVQILEMNEGATKNLGITWPGQTSGFANPAAQFMADKIANWATNNFSILQHFQWRLDALIQEGNARLLSRPRLACQSGKEAELLVGGEKPIFTTQVVSTTGTSGTNVEYKEYGIRLKVKPLITGDDRIKIVLNIEVSEPGTAEFIGLTTNRTAQAYPFTKRNVSTELFMEDGQTLAIGGLIKKKTEEDLRRMPWLSDVPVLGLFFRNRTTTVGSGHGTKGDTELFITLTPRIVARILEPLTRVEAQALEDKAQNTPPLAVGNLLEFIPRYSAIVQKRILENLIYPNAAREARFQGTVTLSLHVAHTGELLEAKLKDSSGYKVLDENALTVSGLILYPPFPSYVEEEELWIDVPVTYRLN